MITELRRKLERKIGERDRLLTDLTRTEDNLKSLKRSLRKHERAREIVKQVGLKTQQQLEYHISDITSLAMEAIFDDPYELKAKFVERRGKTECDLLFVRDEQEVDPLSATGGGAVDVAAFALRVASWSMQHPHSRPTIILDEPMRFLSVDYQEKASLMIKEISEKLGIQFIIITHESTLTEHADKSFRTRIINGVTKIN